MKSVTTTSLMPKELLESSETKWKFDFLGIQPERSKREDHHLTLDDFSDNPSARQLADEMKRVERKVLDAVL